MAVFNASFQTDGSAFSTSFNGNAVFNVGMAEQVVIEIIEGERYDGLYEVIPLAFTDQILETKNKLMTDDITVFKVPYHETSNLFEGKTVYIAEVVNDGN